MEFKLKETRDLVTHECDQVAITVNVKAGDMVEGVRHAAGEACKLLAEVAEKKPLKVKATLNVEIIKADKTAKLNEAGNATV